MSSQESSIPTSSSSNNENHNTPPSHHTDSLETCIRHRHSIRFYKSTPLPQSLLLECLSLARLAPSNSNIQNWHIHIASGPRRDSIVSALQAAASSGPPSIHPLPSHLRHFRSEFGHLLYGPEGYDIAREEKEKMKEASMRNFSFFDAPTIGVISMDAGLGMVDAMSVGMFVQTLMLALTERGAGSCLQVSVVGYPEVLRAGFGLDEGVELLCGIAIGWPAEHNRVNEIVVPREEVEKVVTFLE